LNAEVQFDMDTHDNVVEDVQFRGRIEKYAVVLAGLQYAQTVSCNSLFVLKTDYWVSIV
jgi:hypothetical protein